jgi:hypothetical protein
VKQDVHLEGMIEVTLGSVDVKNSASLMVEVDMFVFRHRKLFGRPALAQAGGTRS